MKNTHTCSHYIISSHVDIHGLYQELGNDLGVIVHGRIVKEGQAMFVLFPKAGRLHHLSTEGIEHGHKTSLSCLF